MTNKNNLSGLYFKIQQSLIDVWLLLTNLDNALEVFLKERPSKYRCKAYAISSSFVLFLF
ncbi:MAG TPA: hypothetical protein VN704_08940 [Verrucomicrobiae bacterium]|jgi:hypothetical protein|nr:hypothetical protein [Verrucomicrobiae bacterium]